MASNKFTAFARLTAGAVAVAVGMLGLAAGTAKAADPGNINPTTPTSLTLHKFQTPNPAWTTKNDGNPITVPAGAKPLEGVQFSITPVTAKGTDAIDLTTPGGWDLIKGATAAGVQAGGWTLGTATNVTTAADGSAFSTLPKGLYLVKETGFGNNQITHPAADFLVTLPFPDAVGNKWIYEVHVYPKNDVASDKVIKKSNAPDKVTQPATVKWDVTIPVASGPFTKFVVSDAIDSRLTYVSATVKQGSTTFAEGTDYNVTGSAVITFTSTGLGKLVSNVPVTIEYTTTVKDGSLGVIENFVNVEINDYKTSTNPTDPNFPGGPQTPTIPDPNCPTGSTCPPVPNPNYPTIPSTNWGKLEILKHVLGSEATVLDGAEFGVYSDATANTQVGTITTANGGIGSLNLWVGNDSVVAKDYWIKETKAPAGYVLDSTTVTKVTVVANATTSTVQQKVANTKHTGPQLPLTGSSVQLGMLIAGLVLIAAGGGLALRRRTHA